MSGSVTRALVFRAENRGGQRQLLVEHIPLGTQFHTTGFFRIQVGLVAVQVTGTRTISTARLGVFPEGLDDVP